MDRGVVLRGCHGNARAWTSGDGRGIDCGGSVLETFARAARCCRRLSACHVRCALCALSPCARMHCDDGTRAVSRSSCHLRESLSGENEKPRLRGRARLRGTAWDCVCSIRQRAEIITHCDRNG